MNGVWFDSGNVNIEFRCVEWKFVLMFCMNGDDVDSVMKCGMKCDIECSRNSVLLGLG